jgi:hypothetical protein
MGNDAVVIAVAGQPAEVCGPAGYEGSSASAAPALPASPEVGLAKLSLAEAAALVRVQPGEQASGHPGHLAGLELRAGAGSERGADDGRELGTLRTDTLRDGQLALGTGQVVQAARGELVRVPAEVRLEQRVCAEPRS